MSAHSVAAPHNPHRASQQTEPTLHVLMPHAWLFGMVGPSSHVS
jgi:hypothetical protein